MIFLNICS